MPSLPHQVFTTQEIRLIEQDHAQNNNGHCYDLMEKAGRTVFEQMLSVNTHPKMVYVLVGKGNNGGDGYIVAAYLHKSRIPYRLFAIGVPKQDAEAYIAYSYFCKIGGKAEFELPDPDEEAERGYSPDIVIDALLGTGLESPPRDEMGKWIDFINNTRAYIISVDIPSGINADTGQVYTECVNANKTICMLGLKPGLVTGDAVDYVGEILVFNLGIDVNSFHGKYSAIDTDGASYLPIFVTTYEDIIADLPMRSISSHKGDSGRLLIIGGDKGYGGAIHICGLAAARTGAGLIKVATDEENIISLHATRPELMTVNFRDYAAVKEAIDWADAIAIGPGLGTGSNAEKLLDLVTASNKPCIADADALTIMAKQGMTYSKRMVLTPHPGEAARLLATTNDKINEDRYHAVYILQQRCGGVVLLKGAGTLICDGKSIIVVHEGSPAMASGGMGDLLTGIIASLRAQGLTLMQSTVAGACVHGRAGTVSGENSGIIGTLASDLLPYIRYLVNKRPGLANQKGGDCMTDIAERTASLLLANRLLQ
ncbi:NAD(P)H-hydrate dehydratase [Anaerobiospirillum succiniciproducens]|uniref:NAD(P)H-hydrate dehydratase n=1 Tax=Anaerobiospirillum succiniciproducens TaxID=13335 RepID=UPI00248D9742|nr:NAD(P)H-hydrate dehydratase [Anaerobiospirillum succiniciproducens]